MNHMGMKNQTPLLPEEITRNILERLPVKSLIRFQCVCKHWKNLIKSRSFVADHLHYSTHQNLSLLLEENNLRLCLLDCELQHRIVQSALPIKSFQGARIVGSCNGLLCVEMGRDDKFPPSLLLWNPAHRAYRYVPRRTYADSDDCVVGFGFSPVVNDYKIVRAYSESYDDVVNRVEVFSLNRGSWKGIDIGNLEGVKLCHESVATNGAISWSGSKLGAKEEGEDDSEEDDYKDDDDDDMEEAEDETEVIVSFDIAREIFILMPRPDLDYDAIEKLAVYENKLAMLCYIWDEDDERSDTIDLWVMEKGTEERWNWIKIYSSNPCSYTLEPMTIWRNHVVCKASSEEDKVKGRDVLYLLNLTTNEAKTFDIPKCCYYVHSMCNYVESLVSLTPVRGFLTHSRWSSIMNQMGMNSQAPLLPEEITRNILKRLPVKSLIQFQCVCKHWKNLINSPSFVADHLHHSTHQNLSLLLEEYNLRLCLLDCELQHRIVQSALPIKSFQGARIVGSCNGLLCVEMGRDDKFPPSLLLWNPAHRAYRYVPRRTYADSDDCVVGFGFSPVVNDYKIVRAYSESYDDVVNRVEVFSLNRGSWKGIDIGNLEGVKLCHESVATNGAIFWSGIKLGAKEEGEDDTEEEDVDTEEDDDDMEEAKDETEVMVSFDIARDIFILMPRPDLDYDAIEKLTVYENKLAMLCDIQDEDDERSDTIDLWVMEKGTEERWNWIKIYSSNPCSYTLEPMTIWRNHVVCKASSEEDKVKGRDALYLLNLTTNEAKTFDIPKCCYSVHSMCNYVESLVSLGTYR